MIVVETLRGGDRAACAWRRHPLHAAVPPMVTWSHRGGFEYLPPYEGPPRV